MAVDHVSFSDVNTASMASSQQLVEVPVPKLRKLKHLLFSLFKL